MHQQTWESTLLLVLTLLPLFSPYARQFSEQTDKKKSMLSSVCYIVCHLEYNAKRMLASTRLCQLYRLLRHEASCIVL